MNGTWLRAVALAAMLPVILAATGGDTSRAVVAPGGGTLGGAVTSAAGAPLAGVCVTAQANGGKVTTTTDAAGRWSLTDLPAGAAWLAFNLCEEPLAGHAAVWWPSASSPGAGHAVTVGRGTVTSDLDVVLPTAAQVRGRVVDDASAPVAGACVSAIDEWSDTYGATRTDASGDFDLAALPAGTYTVVARDCTPPATSVAASTSVTAPSGTATDAPVLRLAGGGSIEGTVAAAHTGRPVAGACVTLWTAEDEIGASLYRSMAVTGLDVLGAPVGEPGRFVFDGVAPGRYRVFFGFDTCSSLDDGYAEEWFDRVRPPGMYEPGATTAVVEVAVGEVADGIAAELLTTPSVAALCAWPPATGFRDVVADGAHGRAIACLAGFGVVVGRSEAAFAPADPVTSRQVATMLGRALAALGASLPADLPDPDGDPGAPVTRGEFADLLVRTYEAATGTALRAGPDRWDDDTGHVYETAMNAAATAGFLVGRSATEVAPDAAVRRDQAATLVARFLDRVLRDAPAA